jgi:HEAT repeat protein
MSKFPFVTLLFVVVSQLSSPAWSATHWLAPTAAVWMQNDPAKPASDPKAFQQLLERINKLEAEVERLKNGAAGQPKEPANGGQIFTLVEGAHLGMVYLPTGQSRFVALQLIVANSTGKPVTLAQDQIIAEIDGEVRKLETIPPEIANQGFQYKNQGYALNSMQPEKTRTVPPGGQISFWLVFPKVAAANSIPKCKLKLALGDTKKEIDVNAVQRAMLGLETRMIGPRGCLALMTITGTMTMFNTQALVDEMEKVVSQKIARVVVRWGVDAPQPEAQIMGWLQNSTSTLGQVRNANEMFPSVPAALREFHLVKFSDKDTVTNYGYRGNNAGPSRIHASSAEAVGAALRTAFVALPRDELLKEIREGDPLTRAAALAFGGARLDTEHLPLIYQWATDKDVDVQKAALQTLSHFGEPEAVEKLVFYVKRNAEPLSSTAIESLAGSRFGTAHEALLELLKNEPPESKKRIVQVLAKYPRPVWSETLYEFASDPRDGLNLDAVKALVQVGHPKLVDILEAGLKGADKPLRDLCFQTLANRSDERSEKLALDYTIAHLKDSPPDPHMNQLLVRTKDPRALPLLLEHLNRPGDHNAVITLLVQIGDQTVAEKLAQKYPTLQTTTEKAQVLNGLRQFRHPKFREFAGAALLTNDNSLVSTAANALMQEGHPEGEKLLIAALEKQTTAYLLHNITNALANYGTPGARAALMKAKESGDTNKQNYARNALQQIRQRSPGFQYVAQGIQRLQNPVDPNDKEAKKAQEKDALEFFETALQLDPEMAEAYAGRGKLLLRQEKLAEAGRDFEKAIELKLEPEDSEVVTGLALTKVVDGKLDEALKLIEAGREKHKKVRNGLYLYNTACVYSRCVQYLREHKDLPDAEKKIADYRTKSLADLEQSIKQGFVDFDWMAKDPDFKTLADDADFKKLISTKPAAKPDEEKADEAKSVEEE